jgi:hypothetical protein
MDRKQTSVRLQEELTTYIQTRLDRKQFAMDRNVTDDGAKVRAMMRDSRASCQMLRSLQCQIGLGCWNVLQHP